MCRNAVTLCHDISLRDIIHLHVQIYKTCDNTVHEIEPAAKSDVTEARQLYYVSYQNLTIYKKKDGDKSDN